MKTETIVYCVVALLLGMLLANMLKNVCGCNTVEGSTTCPDGSEAHSYQWCQHPEKNASGGWRYVTN